MIMAVERMERVIAIVVTGDDYYGDDYYGDDYYGDDYSICESNLT